jgi:hypothetical protein
VDLKLHTHVKTYIYEYGRGDLFHALDDRDHEIHDRLHAHDYDYPFAPHGYENDYVHGHVHVHANARVHDYVLCHHVYASVHACVDVHVCADVYACGPLPLYYLLNDY